MVSYTSETTLVLRHPRIQSDSFEDSNDVIHGDEGFCYA